MSLKGSVPSPAIELEQRRCPGSDRDGGPITEDREKLDNRLPELRSARLLAEGEGLSAQVFVPDDVKPEATVTLRDAPKPAGEKGDVHPFRAHNA